MIYTEQLTQLKKELTSVKTKWEGGKFNDFPFSFSHCIPAEKDGGSTDLYQCVIHSDNAEMVFIVNVNPMTDVIESIDITSVDVIVEGKLYDCINISDNFEFGHFLANVLEDFKGTSTYEVSLPLFVLPFVEVNAKSVEEAKSRGFKMMAEKIKTAFPKCDCRPNEDGSWMVNEIENEMDKAKEILSHYDIDSTELIDAVVDETKTIDGKEVEYIFLDFDENYNSANFCYLRVNGKTYFLADADGQYPANIEESKTYPWTDELGNFFFLNDQFEKVFIYATDWKNSITWKRACDLNARFDCEGIVVKFASNKMMCVRSSYDNENITYAFYYDNENEVKPCSAIKTESIEIEVK